MNYDVLIVGGGPSGLMLASRLSKKLSVLVIEEHESVGVPQHCAGLISIEALRSIGSPAFRSLVNKFRTMELYSPSLKKIVLTGSPLACLVDRVLLEEYLYGEVCGRARVLLGTRVIAVSKGRALLDSGEVVRGKYLVIAEGASRFITSRILGKKPPGIVGLQYDLECADSRAEDPVRVFFSSKYSPKFFSWMIPVGDGVIRVGTAGPVNSMNTRRLRGFVKFLERKGFVRNCRVKRFFGGLIVSEYPTAGTYGDNIIVIGDAAGQTKPLTGGGLYTISILTRILAEAFNSENPVEEYRVKSRRIISRLIFQKIMADLLHNIPDEAKDEIWEHAIELDVGGKLSSIGVEYDRHEENIVRFASKHFVETLSMMRTFPRALSGGVVRGIILAMKALLRE